MPSPPKAYACDLATSDAGARARTSRLAVGARAADAVSLEAFDERAT
jgi:hypothetical protein